MPDDRLELAPRLCVGETAQVADIDLRTESGWCDQGQRRDPPRGPGSGRDRDSAAQRVTDQMGTLLDDDTQRIDSAAAITAIGGAVPVTVVWGSADQVIPATQAESVTGAVRHVLDGAGHMPHMECPAQVQDAVEETIARTM